MVVFDTGQPHAVIKRGGSGFDAAGFPPGQDWSLVFLTWEPPIENTAVGYALGIRFDIDPGPPCCCAMTRSGGTSHRPVCARRPVGGARQTDHPGAHNLVALPGDPVWPVGAYLPIFP